MKAEFNVLSNKLKELPDLQQADFQLTNYTVKERKM